MINRSTHPTSGKTFKEHAENSEIIMCIKCMKEICSTNGDKAFVYASSDYHNMMSELDTIEQGEKSKAEYEKELHRQAKHLVTIGRNLFMGKYYLKYVLKEKKVDWTTYQGYTDKHKLPFKKKHWKCIYRTFS